MALKLALEAESCLLNTLLLTLENQYGSCPVTKKMPLEQMHLHRY